MSVNEKIVSIGMVCRDCGGAITDQKLLRAARNTRWICPFCGAKHISMNDEMLRARVISNDDSAEEAVEAENDEISGLFSEDPKTTRRLHEEYVKRATL